MMKRKLKVRSYKRKVRIRTQESPEVIGCA